MAWFRRLGSQGRDIWNYLHDNCDNAGFFELDLERMGFELGFKIVIENVTSVLNGKFLFVAEDRLFLPAFIEFQYGELSETSKPHLAVIKKIKKQNVWDQYLKGIEKDPKGIHTLKDKDKDKDKDQDQAKEKEDDAQLNKIADEIRSEVKTKDPKFFLSEENKKLAFDTWLQTLIKKKAGRQNVIEREQLFICQAIQREGVNAVVMALKGVGCAPKTDFDDSWFLDVGRVLNPKNFLRFVNLGVQGSNSERGVA